MCVSEPLLSIFDISNTKKVFANKSLSTTTNFLTVNCNRMFRNIKSTLPNENTNKII